jgi:hypothetical protein
VAVGISFATQLVFLVAHHLIGRIQNHDGSLSLRSEDMRRSPQPQVKSIPYSQTSPGIKVQSRSSVDSPSPPGSSGGRSATDTMNGSIRSSMSQLVGPMSSKTRLLSNSQRSQRSSRHRPSLDSLAFRERSLTTSEDGFDSWDTSAVDPQNRQTVLETSATTPGRFLETIPASPTTSRSPSPGNSLDLELPRSIRRSRSYSPASMRTPQTQRAAFTQQPSASESHIHPLFRSDSPTPPPLVTPGTVVTAAPNAMAVISDRESIKSLSRMRSGSLPANPSPLSRQGSFMDPPRRGRAESVSPELPDVEEGEPMTERKMTPPIPDWILSAGSRMSLSGYQTRKQTTPTKSKS